jgi:hypothetical protein
MAVVVAALSGKVGGSDRESGGGNDNDGGNDRDGGGGSGI